MSDHNVCFDLVFGGFESVGSKVDCCGFALADSWCFADGHGLPWSHVTVTVRRTQVHIERNAEYSIR